MLLRVRGSGVRPASDMRSFVREPNIVPKPPHSHCPAMVWGDVSAHRSNAEERRSKLVEGSRVEEVVSELRANPQAAQPTQPGHRDRVVTAKALHNFR